MNKISNKLDITQTPIEVLLDELAKIDNNPRPLTLDLSRRQDIKKELERRQKNSIAPRGCGKARPAYLYWQRSGKTQEIDTTDTDHCGDRRSAAPFGSPSTLLCQDCVTELGLIW
jgi:hypothetical protein